MVDMLETHGHLALATEVGGSRYATGAYGFWRTRVRALAHEAGAPDPDVVTDVLLAPLAPDLYRHQRGTLGYGPARISAALGELARAVLG